MLIKWFKTYQLNKEIKEIQRELDVATELMWDFRHDYTDRMMVISEATRNSCIDILEDEYLILFMKMNDLKRERDYL